MKKLLSIVNRGQCRGGFSTIEVLISALLAGIIITAAFQFYVSLHTQTEKQLEQSEVQATCRSTIFDIKKNLRMAGYRVGGHAPYRISGDSLSIFVNHSGSIDTVLYFLQEFSEWEYARLDGFPGGKSLYRLMKQTNSEAPATYSEFITSINYALVDSANISITITAYTTRPDENYHVDGGYRSFSIGDRVNLRNIG